LLMPSIMEIVHFSYTMKKKEEIILSIIFLLVSGL
jgi:hypothetical protein